MLVGLKSSTMLVGELTAEMGIWLPVGWRWNREVRSRLGCLSSWEPLLSEPLGKVEALGAALRPCDDSGVEREDEAVVPTGEVFDRPREEGDIDCK